MRTAHLLPVFPSMHCSGGDVTCQGVYLHMGVYLPGGVRAGGYTSPGVYLPQGGTCPRGVPTQVLSPHPPVNILLKILPCPKLRLRVVIIHHKKLVD